MKKIVLISILILSNLSTAQSLEDIKSVILNRGDNFQISAKVEGDSCNSLSFFGDVEVIQQDEKSDISVAIFPAGVISTIVGCPDNKVVQKTIKTGWYTVQSAEKFVLILPQSYKVKVK